MRPDVLIVGSGNAALCAALAASGEGAEVLIVEAADSEMAGGNSKYTAGAMRFPYDGADDLLGLLADPGDERLPLTDFGSYPAARFAADLVRFNEGRPLSAEQAVLVDESTATVRWLADNGVRFEPIYDRQSYRKGGRHVFWGGLTVAAAGEGAGLVAAELAAVAERGASIRCRTPVVDLVVEGDGRIAGVVAAPTGGDGAREEIRAGAVVLACGGFEADPEQRVTHLGPEWAGAKVRGTPFNTGVGLRLALAAGAEPYGRYDGCHATPMDLNMPDYGNLDLPHVERKNYRKICYFLGVMLNAEGRRFVDEGRDFRNYTYAQFGREILRQPGQFAWQLFDAKVEPLLYEEYRFHDASFVEADTLDGLIDQLEGVDEEAARATLAEFNAAVDEDTPFDPTVRDGRAAVGLDVPRSNWAQRLDTPPFRAYPVTGGITFTYGGLRVDELGRVLRFDGSPVDGLHACGELVGGVFFAGYPGGSGLTSGAVFGRRAGRGAAAMALTARGR